MRGGRNRNILALRKLVAATAVSSLGDGLVVVGFSLLALHLTKDPLLIAGVAAATRLPWLLVGLPAGAFVDRVDGRRVVLVTDLARAVVVALVALAIGVGRVGLPELYVAAFLLGVGETVVFAASRAVIPLVAKGGDLVKANGQVSAARTANAQFAGPALGGIVFSVAASLPFVGDALSYVVSAVLLRSAIADSGAPPHTPSTTTIRADIRSGLAWFLRSPPLRTLAGAVGSFAFCQAMVLGILVLYASRVLHLGAAGYGLFLAIAALGDVLGSLASRRVHGRLGPYLTVLAAGGVAGGGYLLLGSAPDRYVAVVALALEAAASALGNVATLSARYRVIPSERFGIVNNAFRMCVTGVVPLGALAGGALASIVGTRATFLLAGSLQLSLLAILAVPLRAIAAT